MFYKTLNRIVTLKNRYSEKPVKILKSICSVKNNKITCKNLSQNRLVIISRFLKSGIKIKKFSITENNGGYDFYAEITR
jgi:hypothetical protein